MHSAKMGTVRQKIFTLTATQLVSETVERGFIIKRHSEREGTSSWITDVQLKKGKYMADSPALDRHY